jgi:hypothetical protein
MLDDASLDPLEYRFDPDRDEPYERAGANAFKFCQSLVQKIQETQTFQIENEGKKFVPENVFWNIIQQEISLLSTYDAVVYGKFIFRIFISPESGIRSVKNGVAYFNVTDLGTNFDSEYTDQWQLDLTKAQFPTKDRLNNKQFEMLPEIQFWESVIEYFGGMKVGDILQLEPVPLTSEEEIWLKAFDQKSDHTLPECAKHAEIERKQGLYEIQTRLKLMTPLFIEKLLSTPGEILTPIQSTFDSYGRKPNEITTEGLMDVRHDLIEKVIEAGSRLETAQAWQNAVIQLKTYGIISMVLGGFAIFHPNSNMIIPKFVFPVAGSTAFALGHLEGKNSKRRQELIDSTLVHEVLIRESNQVPVLPPSHEEPKTPTTKLSVEKQRLEKSGIKPTL